MATSNTINLIRTKTSNSPQLDTIEVSLRRSGFIGIILFLSAGLFIGVLYMLFSAEQQNLEAQRQVYDSRITKDQTIEGFFRSIKDRTRIVSSTMNNQRPWAKLLDEVAIFAPPNVLSDISVDNQNKIIVSVNTASLDAFLPVVDAMISEAQAKHLISPQLISFQISKSGSILASFSFTAVF